MRTPADAPPGRFVGGVRERAERATREASPWIEGLGRLGYIAKGIVYVVIGALAVQAALGNGGGTPDQQGALTRIAQAPFGRMLLIVLAVGLLGYALWRFVQAARDTEGKGSDPKGLFARAVYAGIGVIYVGLALSAVQMLLGSGSGGGSQQAQYWTARLLAHPLGAWLVGLAGAGVLGGGLYQLYCAYAATFREKLRLDQMSRTQREWVTRLGRAGYAARGVAFGLIGLFLIVAAVQAQPREARGLDGALATLAQQPFGPWLLGPVAAGLAAYGLYALAEARFRRTLIR